MVADAVFVAPSPRGPRLGIAGPPHPRTVSTNVERAMPRAKASADGRCVVWAMDCTCESSQPAPVRGAARHQDHVGTWLHRGAPWTVACRVACGPCAAPAGADENHCVN